MSATVSAVDFVDISEWRGGVCRCTPAVYHSKYARLCRGLFGEMPMGIDAECQFPDVAVFKDGVSTDDEIVNDGELHEYTFTVVTDDANEPKKSDIVMYDGRLYIIGAVQSVVNPHLEIEPEILWVWPDLENVNDVYSNLNWHID